MIILFFFSYLQYFSTFVETVSNILDVDETVIEENKEASETASTQWVLIWSLIMELFSYVLEIPNNADTILNPNLIGWSTLSHEYCKLIGWY